MKAEPFTILSADLRVGELIEAFEGLLFKPRDNGDKARTAVIELDPSVRDYLVRALRR
jgi:hypothetical protein